MFLCLFLFLFLLSRSPSLALGCVFPVLNCFLLLKEPLALSLRERWGHGLRRMMKEPTWGVKAAYGRVTPHLGSFYSSYRHISRFRKI